MAKTPYYLVTNDDSFNFKQELAKYARNWPWFIASIIVALCIAFFYLKYATVNYQSTGKFKILDDSSKAMELPNDISSLFESSKVNLENEIEILKSHRLLSKVVKELKLNIVYIENGSIKSKQLWRAPFEIVPIDGYIDETFRTKRFTIEILKETYKISASETKIWTVNRQSTSTTYTDLPFTIKEIPDFNISEHIGKKYTVLLHSIGKATIKLTSQLKVKQVGKDSDILSLSLASDNNIKNEIIINEIINQFDLDGILDRQLVSQRTIDFVDNRFYYLTKELDSIESDKKGYKQFNNLSEMSLDTEYTIVRKANTTDEVLRLETQLEVLNILKETLDKQNDYTLLPSNIGLENAGINSLITDYNTNMIYHNKIITSAGLNNPIILNLKEKLLRLKSNILKSVITYEKQTQSALTKAKRANRNTKKLFYNIPKNAQVLRSIERQQKIKETLYILLLEKREEAAINLAITSPSIKIVDYAITNPKPISPRHSNIYFIALLTGFSIPFLTLYLLFFSDSKIHTKDDVLSVSDTTPVTGEIPYIKGHKLIEGTADRSVLSESFRALRTNINHILNTSTNPGKKGKLIYLTSTIKGEGKTFSAVNLALSYVGLNAKTLLLGADFRNPQIHGYFKLSKNTLGLIDYLEDENLNHEDLILNYHIGNKCLDILLSGKIPLTPDEFLSNQRFDDLLESLKNTYDYVIVDTAPTILVTDTMLISSKADTTVYVVRSRFTDKKLLMHSNNLIETGKLVNVSYLVNSLTPSRLYGYNYNYGYNYGYNDSITKKWYSKLFNLGRKSFD